jgi:hypothetical protein
MRNLLVGLVLIAACGDDSGGSGTDGPAGGDGGGSDARADAPIATGMATVVVEENGAAAVGADVVFHAADGTVFEAKQTGNDGRAMGMVHPGSLVTVIQEGGPTTVGGVQPGDEIVFSDPATISNAVGMAQVTLATPVPEGAANFEVTLGCNSANTDTAGAPVAVTIYSDCVGLGNQFNAVAFAFDVDGNPLAYALATDLMPATAGDTAVTMGPWLTDWKPLEISIANPGGNVIALFGELNGLRNGIEFSVGGDTFALGAGPLRMNHPRAFFDRVFYLTLVIYGAGMTPSDVRGILRLEAAPADTVALDLANALPRITAGAATTTEMTWTSEAPLTDADLLLIELNHSNGSATWTFLLPPDTPSPFTLPALPSALSSHLPAGTLEPSIGAVEADWISGFEVIKAMGQAGLDAIPAGDHVGRISLGGAVNL